MVRERACRGRVWMSRGRSGRRSPSTSTSSPRMRSHSLRSAIKLNLGTRRPNETTSRSRTGLLRRVTDGLHCPPPGPVVLKKRWQPTPDRAVRRQT